MGQGKKGQQARDWVRHCAPSVVGRGGHVITTPRETRSAIRYLERARMTRCAVLLSARRTLHHASHRPPVLVWDISKGRWGLPVRWAALATRHQAWPRLHTCISAPKHLLGHVLRFQTPASHAAKKTLQCVEAQPEQAFEMCKAVCSGLHRRAINPHPTISPRIHTTLKLVQHLWASQCLARVINGTRAHDLGNARVKR